MALQGEAEGGGGSPGSLYSKWLGSPNSLSNEDFESWNSFRTRTSSDASTLSGHRSPFPPEQDDLGEPEGHMMYPGAAGAKITSTLPSLSEMGGSLGQDESEIVMGTLLDNLDLLSPKNPKVASDSPSMLQSAPYSTATLPPLSQQDYRKCMYGQVGMEPRPPAPMQTLQETKVGFGVYENQYVCPQGLLKELLSAEADGSRDMMPCRNTLVPQVGRGGCLMPTYSRQSHVGGGVKMMNLPHPLTVLNQGPSTSRDLNSCNMIPLTGPSGAPPAVTGPRTRGQPAHTHMNYGRSYRELTSVHAHGHHHQERLPSDLDNMSIEMFECDMESVLHDTLMDGGALDFNFDPAAASHGFPQRVKGNSHSWVSG